MRLSEFLFRILYFFKGFAQEIRSPAFGMVGVIVFARLRGLPVTNCQCTLLSSVLCTDATYVMAHFSCYCSSLERSGESNDVGSVGVNFPALYCSDGRYSQ